MTLGEAAGNQLRLDTLSSTVETCWLSSRPAPRPACAATGQGSSVRRLDQGEHADDQGEDADQGEED